MPYLAAARGHPPASITAALHLGLTLRRKEVLRCLWGRGLQDSSYCCRPGTILMTATPEPDS